MESIAVDIDGVIADQVPHVLALAEAKIGVRMTKSDVTEWDTRIGGIPFDKLIASYLLDPKFVLSMPVVPGAAKALDAIRKDYKILFASTRPVATENETIEWLHSTLPWVNSSDFVNTMATGKSKLATDYLIDDYIPNLKGFVQHDDEKMGILMAQPWNRQVEDIKDLLQANRIIILEGWEEVRAFFIKRSNP